MSDFQYDIYISFSNNDNIPNNDQQGWVSNFQRFLKILLEQILGEEPIFLFYHTSEKPSVSQINKSGVFISILSNEYVTNRDCIEELNSYFEHATAQGNISIKNTTRILKVVKFPVEPSQQPQVLSGLLGYDLFYTNEISGEVSEFNDFFNQDAERNYWLKLVDLAYDIAAIIKNYKNIDPAIRVENDQNHVVYLAETGADLRLHRDNIKRELLRHGFAVLPDKTLPNNPAELEVLIKKELEKSKLSIHLIGDGYGELIKGSDKSILDLQNKLAGEYSHYLAASGDVEKKFSRLIWISPSAQLVNDKQRIFVDNLRRELEDNEGAEIHTSPIEDFKMKILEELLGLNLDKIRKQTLKNDLSIEAKPKIYFIYDKIDDYEAQKVKSALQKLPFDIISSNFEGELLKLREMHLNNLKICDLGIVFANKVNDIWLQMKYSDLLKASGLGRNKGEIKKYILLGTNAADKVEITKKFDAKTMQVNDTNLHELQNLLVK